MKRIIKKSIRNDIYLNKYLNITYDPNIDVDIELPGGDVSGRLRILTWESSLG